jgi:hypothetical protein
MVRAEFTHPSSISAFPMCLFPLRVKHRLNMPVQRSHHADAGERYAAAKHRGRDRVARANISESIAA